MLERKSRFIGYVRLIRTAKEALGFLESVRKLHPSAGHHVYAYSARGENAVRYSDDGEPHGTAGPPVLEVFKREGMDDYICVVVRYFGGILLGAGGLIRAYAGTAKLALDAAGKARLTPYRLGLLDCPYPLLAQTRLLMAAHAAAEESADYGASVLLEFTQPEANWDGLAAALSELSAGSMSPEHMETVLRPEKI
jgi:uncharacterized YigZ family protein